MPAPGFSRRTLFLVDDFIYNARMAENKLFRILKESQAEFNELLLRLVKIPSYNGERNLINLFQDEVERLFSELRPEVQRIAGERGDLLRMTLFPEHGEKVILLAHADTVRVDASPPEIDESNARLLGNGAYDMKNGIALFYFALRALSRLSSEPACRLEIVVTPDEEAGSPFSAPHLLNICRDARAVLLPEPCCPDGGVKMRRKAIASVDAFLEGKAAHSGIAPEEGRDANRALSGLIRRIDERIAPFQDMTFNPGIIGGGSRTNVVSSQSFLQGEIRTFSNADLEKIINELHSIRDIDGVTSALQCRIQHPALEPGETGEFLFKKAHTIMAEVKYPLTAGSSGGASDGSTLAAAGIPVLDGIGMKGANAHGAGEYVETGDFPFRAYLIARMLQEIQ